MKIYVPGDSAALSVGAEGVARAIAEQIASRRLDVTVVRNGSRGMFWLEPLVEVETPQGRIAYGPVSAEAVPGLFDAGFLEGKPHAFCLGPTEEIPYLKQQERLTFARCGIVDPLSLSDYISHGGYRGLRAGANAHAAGDRRRGHQLRTARAWRRGFSHRHQVEHRSQHCRRSEIHRLQRRRRRQRHLRRPHDHGRRSVRPDRRHDHRRIRGGRHQRLHLHPLGISARVSARCSAPSPSPTTRATWARTSRAAARDSIWKSAWARAPTSAAKKPRCSKAWKASAARSVPSLRCRRSKACSASRPSSTT